MRQRLFSSLWLLWSSAALAVVPPAAAEPAPEAGWKAPHERLLAVHKGLQAPLEAARLALRARIEAEQPELLPKLDQAPPAPRPKGYGLLPAINPDGSDAPANQEPAFTESRYSQTELAEWLAREHSLTSRLAADTGLHLRSLAALVEEYGYRSENFRRIDSHIGYHAFWQPRAILDPGSFERPNRLLAEYRQRQQQDARAAAVWLAPELRVVSAAPGLRLETSAEGERVLRVRLATDIADEGFLKVFAEGVETVWNQAEPMRRARLRIALEWDRRRPEALYPEGPPAPGAALDENRHFERFGADARILTTGAQATHAFPGRAIVMGTAPTSPRVLAHEFGHILGFADSYLRAYQGSSRDPGGVVYVELTPKAGDLMASPGYGLVTEELVRRLEETYGSKP